jgi:hypothetical protein
MSKKKISSPLYHHDDIVAYYYMNEYCGKGVVFVHDLEDACIKFTDGSTSRYFSAVKGYYHPHDDIHGDALIARKII